MGKSTIKTLTPALIVLWLASCSQEKNIEIETRKFNRLVMVWTILATGDVGELKLDLDERTLILKSSQAGKEVQTTQLSPEACHRINSLMDHVSKQDPSGVYVHTTVFDGVNLAIAFKDEDESHAFTCHAHGPDGMHELLMEIGKQIQTEDLYGIFSIPDQGEPEALKHYPDWDSYMDDISSGKPKP
jgi:hypothetical protein